MKAPVTVMNSVSELLFRFVACLVSVKNTTKTRPPFVLHLYLVLVKHLTRLVISRTG